MLFSCRVLSPAFRGVRHFAGGVSIDRRGLVNIPPPDIEESKLTKEIRVLIESLGPLTVAEFMQHALQHPEHGYYTSKDSQIGSAGDFTTAPEISQIFGEAIGVWCVAMWTAMGSPPKFQLVEMGPGKGTLMADVLRATKSFPGFREAATVHLVETSPALRERQRACLNCTPPRTRAAPAPTKAKRGKASSQKLLRGGQLGSGSATGNSDGEQMHMRLPGGGDIFWHVLLQDVPEESGVPMLFIGQEILDALPLHQFEFTRNGWRERLVDVIRPPSPSSHSSSSSSKHLEVDLPFRFVLSAQPTPAVTSYLQREGGSRSPRHLSFEPSTWRETEKQALLLNSQPSPPPLASSVAADTEATTVVSPEKKSADEVAGGEPEWAFPGALPGDEVEVCPHAMALVQDLASRLARNRGAALLVDYGGDHAFPNSLRGFHRHQQAHPLFRPGEVDLTFDVDFAALKDVASKVDGCVAHGPVEQGWFLGAMGAPLRLEALLERDDVDDETAEALVGAYERLVDPAQMGEKYKALALVDAQFHGPVPGGFDEANGHEK